MAEFGAEIYSLPPDFTERVNHYIQQYQGPDHELVAHVLGPGGARMKRLRGSSRSKTCPPIWRIFRWSKAP